MTAAYHYLILISAVMSFITAGVVLWKNRFQVVGPALGLALFVVGCWLLGYAQYFRPLPDPVALAWGHFTLASAILIQPTLFLGLCAVAGRLRRMRWWLVLSFVAAAGLLILQGGGNLILRLEDAPYMDHYLHYNRRWYGLLGLHLVFWQTLAAVQMVLVARRAVGYQRTQMFYYLTAWAVVFLTAHITIIPLEYGLHIPPFGFFVLPLNLVLLAYVMSKARLADYNVVVARILLHAMTLVIVATIALLFIGGMTLVAPGFMSLPQLLFTLLIVLVIGLALAIILPRWLPRAERMMQERLFGQRYGYQDALAGLVKQFSLSSSIDELLATVAGTIHAQMQVSRVLILMQDPLAGTFRIQAQSGMPLAALEALPEAGEESPLVRRLVATRDVVVRDELSRRVDQATQRQLEQELDRFGVAVAVPMLLEGKLVGLLAIGAKGSRDMFFVSDLRVLETLATEVALAVRYRRLEEEFVRKNKLAELGTIAAGVAHEIRNPLASIRTFSQLLPERIHDPEFQNQFSRLVQQDVERIVRVVESMLAFARPAQMSLAAHAVTDLVDEAVLLTQPRLKSKRIELATQYHERPAVNVDKQQILQVLVNLINNAVDALPEHGRIRVATGTRWMESSADGKSERQFAVIEVADNGPGIPAGIRSRLFDPFFTTKRDGTGLGLSISQKIVRDHGGLITLSSVEGKGTAFQVNLPV